MFRSIGILELSFVFLIFAIVPFWKIFSKAGYPGIMSLTMFVPILNVVMLFFLGFSEWPVLKELGATRQRTPPSA
jgi:hypothetical protein